MTSPSPSAFRSLPLKERKFVDAYLLYGQDEAAARAAGYVRKSKLRQAGYDVRRKPEVRAAIAERAEEFIERAGVRTVRVLQESARIAFCDPRKVYKLADDGRTSLLKQPHEIDDDTAAAIAGIEFDEQGRAIRYRFHSKSDQLRNLMQYLKLIEAEHPLASLLPLPGDVSDLERARRIAYLLEAGIRATQGQLDDPRSPRLNSNNLHQALQHQAGESP